MYIYDDVMSPAAPAERFHDPSYIKPITGITFVKTIGMMLLSHVTLFEKDTS